MDHVVYLDTKAKELDKLLSGTKTMIIRGAAGRKMPYGRVTAGDFLYFIKNDGKGLVRAKAKVIYIYNSPMLMRDESALLVESQQDKLQLTKAQIDRWSGKRYLVLVEIADVEEINPFPIDKSNYGNMDNWLPVEMIEAVKK